jgi:hypothetical protein
MTSLNMLIEFVDVFDFTGADYTERCEETGFKKTDALPLRGPAGATVSYK